MTNPLENSQMTWTGRRSALLALDIRVWPAGLVEIIQPNVFWSDIEVLFTDGECPDGV
jgi:hypothetical protein